MINKTQASSLITSIYDGDTNTLEEYLKNGGNPDLVDPKGKSLFEAAIESSKENIVNLLLDHKMDIEKPGMDGERPLRKIMKEGDSSSLKRILEAGAQVNAVSGANGKTAVHDAIYGGYVDDLKLLVEYKANFSDGFNDGCTPWSLLLINSSRMSALMISLGVDVNTLDEKGQNALHIISAKGLVRQIKLLVDDHHMDVNARNNEGNTPLHLAVLEGHVGACEKLLELGADVSLTNKLGHDPYSLLDRANMSDDEDLQMIAEVLTRARMDALSKNMNDEGGREQFGRRKLAKL